VSVLLLKKTDRSGVGLAEVDTVQIKKTMGLNLIALSVGEGDVPVSIHGDGAGESK
jgi:hypothetical protein